MTDIGTKIAQLEKAVKDLQRASRLSHASLDDTALEVRDSAGSLRGVFGQQGDGTTAALVVNGPPPPQPSAPIVASVLGGVTASWNGLFVDGQTLPLDWSRTEVHASTTSSFIPDATTLRSTIETAQGATVVVPSSDPVYVRLVSRSTSGTPSTPSAETGPLGPAPVVATDILDGIVTTVKLAESAVTAAKVATGAIGTTKITDGAVTTPKIIAGAVQTAQLDALAVNASKIAAGAVTTVKLDALAVTTDKLAANAITVGKISAGSVDATALKADAITGKIITGGEINGAVVTGGVVQTGTSGTRVRMAPDAAGEGGPGVALYSGAPNENTPGLLWATVLNYGSFIQPTAYLQAPYVDSGSAYLRLVSPAGGGVGRFQVSTSSTRDYAYVRGNDGGQTGASQVETWAQDGATGPSSTVQVKGSQVLLRSADVAIQGPLSVSDTTFTTYTPVVAGGGSATFTTRTGWYYKLGKLVYVNAEFVVGTAGSGSAQVTVTAPSNIYRNSRQALTAHARGAFVGGMAADGAAILLESTSGGSGNVIDQLALSNDAATNRDGILNGSNLLAGARITISGWYREA